MNREANEVEAANWKRNESMKAKVRFIGKMARILAILRRNADAVRDIKANRPSRRLPSYLLT